MHMPVLVWSNMHWQACSAPHPHMSCLSPCSCRYAGPGAKLAVGTEPPATRDNRLQAWAGDLFAQLEVQRQVGTPPPQ